MGKRTEKERQRAFLRWDFIAHWRTDLAGLFSFGAGGYCLLALQSIEAAAGLAVLGSACAIWPRSGGLRARVLGSGFDAPKGSELPAEQVVSGHRQAAGADSPDGTEPQAPASPQPLPPPD